MKIPLSSFSIVLLTTLAFCQSEAGCVPDSDAAGRVAETVLLPVYGKKQIESENLSQQR